MPSADFMLGRGQAGEQTEMREEAAVSGKGSEISENLKNAL